MSSHKFFPLFLLLACAQPKQKAIFIAPYSVDFTQALIEQCPPKTFATKTDSLLILQQSSDSVGKLPLVEHDYRPFRYEAKSDSFQHLIVYGLPPVLYNHVLYMGISANAVALRSPIGLHLWVNWDLFELAEWEHLYEPKAIPSRWKAGGWLEEHEIRKKHLRGLPPCDFGAEDSGESCYFNSQAYAKAGNDTGYIINISHLKQWAALNDLLRQDKEWHGANNQHKVAELAITLLDERRQKKTQANFYYTLKTSVFQFEPSFAELQTSTPDSVALKIKGLTRQEEHIVYFEGIKTEEKNGELHYAGIRQQLDSIPHIQQHLQLSPPDVLLYKFAGNNESAWYNYFLAFDIEYDAEEIPQIRHVRLLCPRRIYRHWCYPAGICDDVGQRFTILRRWAASND